MSIICVDLVARRVSTMPGGTPAPVPPTDIEDVGFVYTSALGDDTPFSLDPPAHSAGDAIFVWCRGHPATPDLPVGKNSIGTTVLTFESISQQSQDFGNNFHLAWAIDVDGDVTSVESSAGTSQIGIHVYRGVTGVGAVAVVTDVLDNFGADIPGLTLDVTDGSSRVWCGVIFNQLKAGASEPNEPTGLTKRLTSPSTLGGGTGVSYDTTAGVASFAGAEVDAFGAAYYMAWAVEMLAGAIEDPDAGDAAYELYTDLRTDTLYVVDGTDIVPLIGGNTARTATWRSRRFVMPPSPSFAWLRVNSDFTDDVIVRLYRDGLLHVSVTVTSKTPVRVPAGRGRIWELEIESAARVTSVRIATSSAELVDE